VFDIITKKDGANRKLPDLPDCLHGSLPGPFLLSYTVFDFTFSLFFRFLAVR